MNPSGIIITQDGMIHQVNTYTCEILSLTKHEMIGRAVNELFPGVQLVEDQAIEVTYQDNTLELELSTLTESSESIIVRRMNRETDCRNEINKYRTLIDLLPQTVFEINMDGNIEFLNNAGYHVFGIDTSDSKYALTVYEMIAPQDHRRFRENMEKLLQGESGEGQEYLARDRSDNFFPVIIHAAVVYEENRPVGFRGLIVNITRQKLAEEALRESEQKLADIIMLLPDATFVIDVKGRVLFWNRAMEEFTGVSGDQIIGKDNYEYALPFFGERRPILIDLVDEPTESFSDRYDMLQKTENVIKGFTFVHLPHLGERYVHSTASALYDYAGNKIGAIEIIRDVTVIKRIEVELAHRLDIESTLSTITPSFINVSIDEFDIRLNEALEKVGTVIGVDRGFVFTLSENLTTIHNTHEWCRPGVGSIMETNQELRSGDFPWWFKKLLEKRTMEIPDVDELPTEAKKIKDFLKRHMVRSMLTVPMMEQNRLVGFIGFQSTHEKEWLPHDFQIIQLAADILVNVFIRRKMEDEMREAKVTAESANRAKSVFLASMSHEIRTPMNAVLGFTEILLKTNMNSLQREYLEHIQSAAKNLLTIINDILDLSKIEAGKLSINPEPIDIRFIIRELRTMFELKLERSGVDFIINVDENIPETLIMDEVRLRQILFNLIGNAVKFTAKGHVKISVVPANQRFKSPKLDIELSVEDTGIGISPSALQSIFEPFHQQDSQSEKLYGGTGLGLAITKRLVEMMRGEISVSSKLKRGSCFRVLFRDVKKGADHSDVSTRKSDKTNLVEFEPATILIADDVPENRSLIDSLLSGTGLNMIEAHNGQSAVKIAKRKKPALILMDIRMPIMNGYEAARIIKSNPATKNIPVIGLTASINQSDAGLRNNRYFDRILLKPFNGNDLSQILGEYLPFHYTQAQPRKRDDSTIEELDMPQLNPEERTALKNRLTGTGDHYFYNAVNHNSLHDAQQLGEFLNGLGDEYHSRYLTEYGKHLMTLADNFDIEKIAQYLEKYPEIRQNILFGKK